MAPFGMVNVSPRKQESCILDAPPTDFEGIQPKAPTKNLPFATNRKISDFGLQNSFPLRSHPSETPIGRRQTDLPGLQK
jgi:hypothetical protein